MARSCCRPTCASPATATMTYDYRARTVWVDGLDGAADPNGYDLCTDHADRTGVPRGWEFLDRRLGRFALTSFGVGPAPARESAAGFDPSAGFEQVALGLVPPAEAVVVGPHH